MRLTADRVHATLADHPGSTISQLADLLGVPRKTAENHLYRLADQGRAHNDSTPTGSRPGAFAGGSPARRWYAGAQRRAVASVWDLAQ